MMNHMRIQSYSHTIWGDRGFVPPCPPPLGQHGGKSGFRLRQKSGGKFNTAETLGNTAEGDADNTAEKSRNFFRVLELTFAGVSLPYLL